MACLSIKYYCCTLKCENTNNASLLWSMRTNQRWWLAQNWTLSSVTMSDTSWSVKERCTTDDVSTVSAGVLVILLFLTRSFRECEKENCSSKTFGFFSNKLSLELGISSCFFSFIAYLILSVSISSVKIISISADNDFSPLSKYIFKRNLFMKYVCKYKNRPYMYIYNWKDLKVLFPSDFWVIL